jgi:replication factor C large subunit
VPLVYEPDELKGAYDFLGTADRWLGRVRATQNYSYWRYVTDNVSGGVASVRTHTRSGWTRYGGHPYRSSRDSTRDYVARQVATTGGLSISTARREVLPYLATMTHHCHARELTIKMAETYDLDESEVAFVTGSGESTNKVEDIVAEAGERRERAAVQGSEGAFTQPEEDEAPAQEADAPEETANTSEESAEHPSGTEGTAEPEAEESGQTDQEDADEQDEEDEAQAGLDEFV